VYRFSVIAVAIALLSGCANQNNATNPQLNAGAPTQPMQGQRASGVRSNAMSFQVYTAGQTPGFPSTAGAFDIAAGPDQTMWFTDPSTPAVGRIASDGTFKEFTKGLLSGAKPYAITAGPDGNMYFSDYNGVRIGRVTPAGTIKEYGASKFTDTFSKGIAVGLDGRPWIVGFGVPSIIAHLKANGTFATHTLPEDFTPDGTLTEDASGNLWFIGQDRHAHAQLLERVASTGKITRLPMHMVSQRLPCCPNQAANSMIIGPGGAPWFTTLNYLRPEDTSFHLGTVTNNAVVLERITHHGLSYSAYPSGIAASGNTLWMTGGNPFKVEGALWHFDAKRNQTAYPVPYDPISLAVDASGNPWFTAAFGGSAAQIVEVLGTAR
jgi:streptogramin lyase